MPVVGELRQPVGTAFTIRDPLPWPDVAAIVREGEGSGYAAVFLPETGARDTVATLMGMAGETEELLLGTGVIPMPARTARLAAMAAATVQERSGGRHILGVGTGPSGPGALERLRAYVEGIRELVGGSASGAALRLPLPVPVPIWIAALGPRAVRLAGEIADGVILWLSPPQYVRDVAVPALERGRRRAGRPLAGFDIVAAVPLAISDDREAALTAFRGELARYASLPFYRAMLAGAGLGGEIAAFDRDKTVSVTMAEALGGVGSAKAARDYVEAYRRAGVTLPAVRPITFPDAPWYRRTLEEAAKW
jgi:alkanesulfonate monooxygenase SsuD/methylene tetrahydromethanopterin reductase-like flavin-dependent oxidoreductase (luciferase family)